MKRVLLGALALILGSWTAASAAPAPSDWTGLFAGVVGAYGSANRTGCWNGGAPSAPNCATVNTSHLFDYKQTGGLGGIQFGYNWQLKSSLLFGVQADALFGSVTGTIPSGSSRGTGTWNDLLIGTGKLGWTSGPFLLYGDAGFATSTANFKGYFGCNFSMTHAGPVAGAGASWKLTQMASVNLEYDHIWLGTQNTACTGAHTNDDVKTTANMDILKVGLDFKLSN